MTTVTAVDYELAGILRTTTGGGARTRRFRVLLAPCSIGSSGRSGMLIKVKIDASVIGDSVCVCVCRGDIHNDIGHKWGQEELSVVSSERREARCVQVGLS